MSSPSIPTATLDRILTAQLTVAWAGEDDRLGWWRTDLASEFGGEDLFQRLLPGTWRWAVLQGAREAARRRDAAARAQEHDADRLVTLFRLGPAVDERLDEHLADLKRDATAPPLAFEAWDRDAFGAWVRSHGAIEVAPAPSGRRLKGAAPDALDELVDNLVAALDPLGSDYPLPHYRRSV